ncbi:hypothetical protein FFLO_06317 [Filobasidium floriforme]|uniref:Transcription factor domain-containing protein n=1 Tax=Filobasidium floriforme TaxID=5210 RepID=A0A8K0NMA1_9TREE|nr:hypothetical protein FFLO_06317 [Filobasidium floriforme]
MPRELALDLQHIYIDYLWQLVPLLHPPSHLHALDAGFDKESPEFLTVVLAIATYTTALAPNAWIDVPPAELYGFLVGCIETLEGRIKVMVAQGLSFSCLVSQYLLVAALDSLDLHDQSMLAWAQVVQMTTMLRLFEEDVSTATDLLERETHLRMYWLVFGGDKSHSCSFTHPPALRSVDFGPVTHVQPLPDEYLSAEGSLSKVPRSEAILGFRYVSRLFEILEKAEILYHAGRFRLAWDEVRATLNRFDEINFENEKALAGCERPFRLDSGDLLASDLEANANSWTSAEADSSSHNRWDRPDPYVVAKANIYMTQLITKCYISKAKQIIVDRSGYPFAPEHDHARLTRSLCEELLFILRCWPPQAVAVNGRTVLGKVRWIASHRLEQNLEDLDEHDQQVLLDMLTVFGNIEARSLVTPIRAT